VGDLNTFVYAYKACFNHFETTFYIPDGSMWVSQRPPRP